MGWVKKEIEEEDGNYMKFVWIGLVGPHKKSNYRQINKLNYLLKYFKQKIPKNYNKNFSCIYVIYTDHFASSHYYHRIK
jgi:hypothetical protein